MLCGWEGDRRSDVALAMHHRLGGLSTYVLNGQCAGDEHPSYASWHGSFTLPFYINMQEECWAVRLIILECYNM